ncbi:MAG: helical backbone metal receptor [Candidatus Bathyarchaeia archaeon]
MMVAASSVKPRVYYELWYDPLMSFGPDTVLDELIVRAGGENIFHDDLTMYPIVSSETVIQRDSEIVIVPESYMGASQAQILESGPAGTLSRLSANGVYT